MGIFNEDQNKATSSVADPNSTWATQEEEKAEFHYSEAKRLLLKAEDAIASSTTSSAAETYVTMARMHMYIWSDLKSIISTGHVKPIPSSFSRETVTSGSSLR